MIGTMILGIITSLLTIFFIILLVIGIIEDEPAVITGTIMIVLLSGSMTALAWLGFADERTPRAYEISKAEIITEEVGDVEIEYWEVVLVKEKEKVFKIRERDTNKDFVEGSTFEMSDADFKKEFEVYDSYEIKLVGKKKGDSE